MATSTPAGSIGELGESGVLALIFARLADGAPDRSPLLVGPGDDTAYLQVSGAGMLATTDTMVRGQDWLDHWSSGTDVGAKVVVQNLADIAAMGGVATAVLVTLVAPGSTPTRWVVDLIDGIAATAHSAGVSVAGGDLSSSQNHVSVSVTALGVMGPGRDTPVLRSGASAGEVLAVSGPLGRSAAGLEVLRRGDEGWFPSKRHAQVCSQWVGYHCRPDPDLTQGPIAAAASATSLIDVSDGLVRDANRVAQASGVRIDVDSAALAQWVGPIAEVLGLEAAGLCVRAGGEEHVLLGTFALKNVPPGWFTLGDVSQAETSGAGAFEAGRRLTGGGWDHFGS